MSAIRETADIETASSQYARRFAGRVGAWFLQVQEQAVLEMLAPYPGARVLDVGGGHGQLTGGLLRSGHRVSVLSSAELPQTQLGGWVAQGKLDFRVGSVVAMPYPDRSFDVAVSIRLLSHVRDWQRFLDEITRVAGQAVIFDYAELRSANALAPRLFKWKKQIERDTRPYHTFKEEELALRLRQNGFEIEQRYPQFLVPMVVHRSLKSPRLSAVMESAARRLGLTRRWGSPVIVKAVRRQGGGSR